MGSAVLFYFFDFRGFCMVALLHTVVITSNCPLLCEIHVEPFKTLQNQNFHISPPLTPRSPPILHAESHPLEEDEQIDLFKHHPDAELAAHSQLQ